MSLTRTHLLGEIEWIPRPRSTQLRRLGLETVGDLLTHYPRRHEDRREFAGFPREASEQPICLCGEVTKTRLNRFGRGKKIFEVTLEESDPHALSQPLVCRWFNLHYIQKMILTGQRLVVFGKPRQRGQRICMEHPEFEIIENDDEISIHFRRITPIYPATEGLSQRVLRSMIYRLLDEWTDDAAQTLLPFGLAPDVSPQALREIHFPPTTDALARARETLVLAEFFALQMLLSSRRARARARTGGSHSGPGDLLKRFLHALPFDLTNAQVRVIEELQRDLRATFPMNRLLQGDVGSGKTVVAIAAMLLAVEAGFQVALMAPTQILAEQHYAVLRRGLEPLGVPIALRTGARKEDPLPLFAIANTQSSGSACLPRVGDGVPPSRNFPELDCSVGARIQLRRLPHIENPWVIYAVTIGTKARRRLSPAARSAVLDALLHFHNKRYELFATSVMPDHVHLLIQPWPKGNDEQGNVIFWHLSELLRAVKSFFARRIDKLENSKGGVWEREEFDRYVRSDRDLEEKFRSIVRKPWDSKVAQQGEEYPWLWTQDDAAGEESWSRWNSATRSAAAPAAQRPPELGQIFVGTHALLYDPDGLENPGLVVIDEQHKFGVAQRSRLTTREPAPDVLVMTATPIPRTLTMSLYGDLDVSTIEEMPAGRGRIVTATREAEKLPDVLAFLRRELEAGRQAFVVYPLIDESEKLEAKAASSEFEKWCERLQPFTCELLHGRIPAPEKQGIMERFRRGLTSVLIGPTVIEVGVDVPNATVMLIENAERFGLAQLHQLRGRIGRGEHKSYCILLGSNLTEETKAKLAVLERTSNGFEVAEADWELRGPGDLLGTAQSGLPELKLGNLRSDGELMRRARVAATEIFRDDPLLAKPENQRFRCLVVEEVGKTFSHVS